MKPYKLLDGYQEIDEYALEMHRYDVERYLMFLRAHSNNVNEPYIGQTQTFYEGTITKQIEVIDFQRYATRVHIQYEIKILSLDEVIERGEARINNDIFLSL